jgi:hypothetical protein
VRAQPQGPERPASLPGTPPPLLSSHMHFVSNVLCVQSAHILVSLLLTRQPWSDYAGPVVRMQHMYAQHLLAVQPAEFVC